ncbi:MAG: Rne/Rng family ribonuclease, partial [Gaiellaceae bacterium]
VDEIVLPELDDRERRKKKIEQLIKNGQSLLVQVVKDPMGTKGARVTMDVSLAGRFLVYSPDGKGYGVSKRLPDGERDRLRDLVKTLTPKGGGGLIVRTAARGAQREELERDLDLLEKQWASINAAAKKKTVKAPALIHEEVDLALEMVRDDLRVEVDEVITDDEATYERIRAFVETHSPEFLPRIKLHQAQTPLLRRYQVEDAIRSTMHRRVDLPSGGYLLFDYAEAFTIIDVNTGRFVGARGKASGGRLEDTITKNNLEAVKEVVRQLRLRDIGGIIVIDFIDMANPKNRATVEGALKTELERDRTKTYVVEISPLGLVEMTRQNVTDGPREILTRKCIVCGGDGVVLSETSAAVDAERRLRALAASAPRTKAFKVELESKVAAILVGPAASRLLAIEEDMKRRFLIVARDDAPVDHFDVLGKGTLESLLEADDRTKLEGKTVELKLGEVGRYDVHAGIGKLDGLSVCVAQASGLVGKKAKVRIERVLDGTAYATLVGGKQAPADPITAESAAEKPTRKPPAKKQQEPEGEAAVEPEEPEEAEETEEAEAVVEEGDAEPQPQQPAKKKTRRGSRGGRRRKKKPATAAANGGESAAQQAAESDGEGPRIHLPDPALGREEAEPEDEAPSDNGAEAQAEGEQPKPKKKTRRGSRGGRNRRRRSGSGTATAESPPAD